MRSSYLGLALALGVVGFLAVEIAGRVTDTMTAITAYWWLDLAVFALAAVVLAMLFQRAFRRTRALLLFVPVLGFVLLFAPLAALLAAAAELTLDGLWGVPSLVGSAFVHTPTNLVYALTVDVGFVALPLGVVSAGLLAWQARRSNPRRAR